MNKNENPFIITSALSVAYRVINTKGKTDTTISKEQLKIIKQYANMTPKAHNDRVLVETMRLCLSYLL